MQTDAKNPSLAEALVLTDPRARARARVYTEIADEQRQREREASEERDARIE